MRLSYSVRANERPLVTFIYKHYGSCFFSCLVVSGSAKDIEREIFPLKKGKNLEIVFFLGCHCLAVFMI